MATIKTKGVILKRKNFGEADRILTVYTEKLGKVSVIAKGSRKALSKLAGHIEAFYLSNLMLAEGKNLYTLTSAEIVKNYPNLRNNLETANQAFYVMEIIDKLTEESNPSKEIFLLLVDTLKNMDSNCISCITGFCLLKMLVYLGHKPELSNCVKCGKKLKDETNYFSALLGGIICQNCRQNDFEARKISVSSIKIMRVIVEGNYDNIKKIIIASEHEKELEKILRFFAEYIAEKKFNSPGMLKIK